MYRYWILLLLLGCTSDAPTDPGETPETATQKAQAAAPAKAQAAPSPKAAPQTAPAPAPAPPQADAAPAAPPTADSAPQPHVAGTTLSDAEADLLWPLVSDLRTGVQPFDAQSVGICRCKNDTCGKDCDTFMGLDVNNPPPGKYQIRAAFKTPRKMPDSMKTVDFAYECTTLKKRKNGESKNVSNASRSVRIGRSGKNGYRVSRSRVFESPSRFDEMACTWRYTLHNQDGDKVIKGSYVVTNQPPSAPAATPAPVVPPPPAATPTTPPRPTGPLVLSPAEMDAFGDSLQDLRAGVRPFDDKSVGICRCNGPCGKACDEYIGLVADKPPAGDYQVRAALHTPRLMPDSMLQIGFEHECTVTIEGKNGSRTSTDTYNRTFQIGKSNRKHGYRLTRTKTFKSPRTKGRRHCTWRYRLPGVGGEKTIEGSYTLEPRTTP